MISSKISGLVKCPHLSPREGQRQLHRFLTALILFSTLLGSRTFQCANITPCETIKTNIAGTHKLVDLCLRENVGKVIFTSTGKAVKPTTVYGATKLLAERLLTLANSKQGGPGNDIRKCKIWQRTGLSRLDFCSF